MLTGDQDKLRFAGVLFVRTMLGIIFFMQGFGKIFSMGLRKVYDLFFRAFENTIVPKWLIVSTCYYTSYVEWIGGFLLIIGLFRNCAICLLALDLLIVSFGHGLMEPIWDLSHVFPRAVLLATLFFIPQAWDGWSVDRLFERRSGGNR